MLTVIFISLQLRRWQLSSARNISLYSIPQGNHKKQERIGEEAQTNTVRIQRFEQLPL